MADARFKAAAKRLKETLGKKYETAETTPTAGAVGAGLLYIDGQIYNGAIDGVTTVKNTGRLAAAQYAPTTGGSTISRGGGGTSSGGGSTGVYLPLDGSVAMTGSLDMGGHDITNVVTVDGRNLEADGITLDAIKAAPLLTLGGNGTLTNERSLLFGSSFDTVDGGANAGFTVSLKTPGPLDVATANDAANNHTHAVIASSAPGNVSSLLKSASDGSLILTTLTATTKLRATLIDTVTAVNLTLQPGANLLLSPATGAVTMTTGVSVGAANYASQTTGWRVTYAGEGDFRYLYTDEMHAKAFIADLEQALAGGQIIAKSVTLLYLPFTAPAAGVTAPLTVKDLPSATGMAVFQNGDIVRLRQFSRAAGSLSITDCWGSVVLDTSYGVSGFDTATKSQRYTFTRSVAPNAGAMSTGAVIPADAIILDYGTSGNGYYEVNAIDGLYAANSPYAQIVTWTGHPATGKTLKMRLGNLSGVTDTALNPTGYGLYSDNVFLKGSISAANNQVLINGDGLRVRAFADPEADIDDVNAYRFERQDGTLIGGLYSAGNINGHVIDLTTYAPASGYANTKIRAIGTATAGAADVFLYATSNPSTGKEAIVWIDVDNTAALVRLIADDYIRFESPTQSFSDHSPFLDLGANLGSVSKRWGVLYANQIIAGTISGASMAGATWQYTGSMVIDANSGADTVVSVVNSGAGAVVFNVEGVITQSGTAVSLNGHTHSTYLLKSGDTITGNIGVSAGVTIDGVDISAHAADANAHHARSHAITSSSDHTVTGATLDVVGLTATNTLGILTPSANPGAASALLKTDTAGTLTLVQLIASTKVRTALIDTAAGNLTLAPVGGTVAVTGALTVTTTISAGTNVRTPAIVSDSGNLSIAPATNITAVTGALSLTGTLSSSGWNVTNAGAATLVTVAASTSVTTPTVTTASGNLTLTSVGGTVAAVGALTVTGTVSSTSWNITSGGAATLVSGAISGNLTVGGTATVTTSVSTPIVTYSSNLTLSPAGNLLLAPGSNLVQLPSGVTIGSDNYASRLTGWRADYSGAADFRTLYVDEMVAKSFIADLEQALAGGQIISKSVAQLAAAFIVPAAGGTATLTVRDLPSAPNMQVFQSGDTVGVRTFSRAGGSLTIGWAWGTVSGYADGVVAGTQTWTFTRLGSTTYSTVAQRGTATSASASAATSRSASKPTGVVSGDGLYAIVTHDGSADTITPPSGWTQLQYVSGTDINAGLFYKVAGSSEPSSYSFSTVNTHAIAVTMVAYSGVDTANYAGGIGHFAIQANAASANLTAPSVNVGSSGDVVLFLGGISNNTAATPPGDTSPAWTEQIDTGSTGIRVYLASRLWPAGGATGNKTATIASSSHASIGAMIVLSAAVTGFDTALAGALNPGTVIPTDSLALDFGVAGNGYYEVTALDGNTAYGGNAPYMQIVTWASHPASGTPRVRTGNLAGLFGVANEYGMYAGSGVTVNDTYVRLSSYTAQLNNVPLVIYETGSKRFEVIPSAGLSLLADNSLTNRRQQVNWFRDLDNKSATPAASIIVHVSGTANATYFTVNQNASNQGASMRVGVPLAYMEAIQANDTTATGYLSASSWIVSNQLGVGGAPLTTDIKLEVTGHARINYNNSLYFQGKTDAGEAGLRLSHNSGSYIDSVDGDIVFRANDTTGGTERMRISYSTGAVTFANNIGTDWTNLPYAGGWGDYGAGFQPGQYKKVGDLVFLRGLVARTSGTSAVIATLPVGYRPQAQCLFRVYTNAFGGGDRVDVKNTGAIELVSGGVTFVQLDGLVFSTYN